MSTYKPKKRDGLGAMDGSIAAKVNEAMTGKWQSVEVIQKKVGMPMRSVRRRLYQGVYTGLYEYERVIQFKLKKRKSKK
jgi:hypothetical protein